MKTLQQCIDAWNAQADEYNHWDELSADEKCEWCITCCANHAIAEAWDKEKARQKSMPLKWHKECVLEIWRDIADMNNRLKELTMSISIEIGAAKFYEKQIAEAGRTGKASFNRDKYMMKRIKPKEELN